MRPNATGAKANVPWAMPTIKATTRGTSSFTNSVWAISGGSEVALPIPDAEQDDAEQQQRHVRAGGGEQQAIEPAICTA